MEKEFEEAEGVLPTLALLMSGDIRGAIRRAQVSPLITHLSVHLG